MLATMVDSEDPMAALSCLCIELFASLEVCCC